MFHNFAKCFLSIMNTFCTNHKLHNCSRCCLKPLSLMIEIHMEHFQQQSMDTNQPTHLHSIYTSSFDFHKNRYLQILCKIWLASFLSIKIWQVVHKFVTRTTVISSHVCPDLSHFQCSDTAVSLLLVA